MTLARRVADVHILVRSISGDMRLCATRVLAYLPDPHQLRVVPAATAMVHRQLGLRAQTRAVLTAPSLRL